MNQRETGSIEDAADAIGAGQPADTLRSRDTPDGRYPDDASVLNAARQVGETVLGPNAEATDCMTGPNPLNFEALAQAGLLGMGAPREFGGLDASGNVQREVTRILASYCGVTTFIQAQHHGPCRMIAGNSALRSLLLPDLASGTRMCGISFAHLRRPGPPVLSAEPVPGGFRLSGKAPWVTGWGLMNQVVFGATLPDGRFVYVWSPGNRAEFPEVFAGIVLPEDTGTLESSAPLALCAMNASATVELTLDRWFVPEVHRLSESDRDTMRRNDRNGVLNATAMPLGCAEAGLRVLNATAEKRGIPAVHRAAASFQAEWEDARGQTDAWMTRGGEPEFFETAVKLRAWCIELASRCAHAAVTASSGAANMRTHPAQRLLREAMFYTIQAQTQEVLDATLARLER